MLSKGLDADMLNGYCKQLLKMIAKNESLIKQCEGGRLDISIPNRYCDQPVKQKGWFSLVYCVLFIHSLYRGLVLLALK